MADTGWLAWPFFDDGHRRLAERGLSYLSPISQIPIARSPG